MRKMLAAGAIAGGVALFAFAPIRVAGQSQTTTAPPKTSWGAPDLQGIWGKDGEVPLQRPARFANKEFFTDQERAALDKQVSGILDRDSSEGRRKRGTEQDVGGAYNAAVFTTHLRLGRRTSLIVDPPDGRIPPVTAAAQKRRDEVRAFQLALLQPTLTCKDRLPACADGKYGPPSPLRNQQPPVYIAGFNRADNPEDRSLSERCLAFGLPDFGSNILPFYPRIVQSREAVSIFYDVGQGNGWQRVIPITDRPHLSSTIRQWWGDSRGRWDGNTLVVDVTNFGPKLAYQGSTPNLHLVERFTRVDANRMEYEVKIEDPETWTRPWTVKQDWVKQDDALNRHYMEPRCHEGNYGLAGQLVGGRADDRTFAEGRGPDPATLCTAGCGGFAGGFADDGDDSNPLR